MATATVVGGVLGLGVPLYVNAVRKMPLWRNPWEHVLWTGAGAAFGGWLVEFEKKTEKELAGEPAGDRGGGAAASPLAPLNEPAPPRPVQR